VSCPIFEPNTLQILVRSVTAIRASVTNRIIFHVCDTYICIFLLKLCNYILFHTIYNFCKYIYRRVKWVPCHHGMARPQVADGGDGLQIRRVAANILNKQSRTAGKGFSSSWGLGVGLTTLALKNNIVTKCQKGPRTWTDSLHKRPELRKIIMIFGTLDVRSLNRAASLMRVSRS
jgi:hypothetical protein